LDHRGTRKQGSGEDYLSRSFILLDKYYSDDLNKKNEMGFACSTL